MPELDKQAQKPFKVNQIESTKPNTPRTDSILSGYIANSMNGGHNKVIAFKKIMAGEKHKEYRIKMNIQMLTPKTPTYQNLKMTIRTYFVPNSRVWKNAEKYTAQKGGSTEIKIQEIPNLAGKEIPVAIDTTGEIKALLSDTDTWRDSFISSYIPRIGYLQDGAIDFRQMPAVSVLPLRGRVAIYNDMERNKEYDTLMTEYNDDTVSNIEWRSYLPTNTNMGDYYNMRAKRDNSYYTDYRLEYQGFEEEAPSTADITNNLITWASWESKIAEARSQAENAQMNDWEVIAKIRGSKVLTEGKVQLIGKKTFNLNYSAITQNTYNNNTNIAEEFQVMGKQGAYSYTEIETPLYAGMEFIEEGYIHVIATVSADTVFENAFDRMELNVTPLDEYRPDLVGEKFDTLKAIEMGTMLYFDQESLEEVVGFKRKFSEYFKLPNIIAGDLTTKNYKVLNMSKELQANEEVITQKTFQFFEEDRTCYINLDGQVIYKHPWKDYTDIMINKNQAILNDIQTEYDTENPTNGTWVKGNNQIYFVGVATCIADLPIDESIKNNYTQWGEH